ncbi:hypothetical protein PCE1_003303 [Barthelona sp. PCE]
MFLIGLDSGSTTVKAVILDAEGEIQFSTYRKHNSHVKETALDILKEMEEFLEGREAAIITTGSSGMFISEAFDLIYIQEVICAASASKKYYPETRVAIEIGGEDVKALRWSENGNMDNRMNNICAGGTGAFLEQCAKLLDVDVTGINQLAHNHEVMYSIASRCGVFAKTDIQALLNQGAKKEDIAASIFKAVVDQTISGLGQGQKFEGPALLLGGPLFYLDFLAKLFTESLKDCPTCVVPENANVWVAMGAALAAHEYGYEVSAFDFNKLDLLNDNSSPVTCLPKLFTSEAQLTQWNKDHAFGEVKTEGIVPPLFLGIDAGSTTTKLAAIDSEGDLVWHYYQNNKGSPIHICIQALNEFFEKFPDVEFAAGCSTGYGEFMLRECFGLDFNAVETVCHSMAAAHILPGVEMVIDIGGQDVKGLWLDQHGSLSNLVLNEACSSGCGSFLALFAASVGMGPAEFAKIALEAESPVDLGSRCTVFMQSMVKTAQKQGFGVPDISAGLAYSIVKNLLHKVLRTTHLPEKIVVQGGTFKSNAVLRALEIELKRDIVRAPFPELMGCIGAALFSKKQHETGVPCVGLDIKSLDLEWTQQKLTCNGCANKCLMTALEFNNGACFVSGNKCSKGETIALAQLNREVTKAKKEKLPNIYSWKIARTFRNQPVPELAPEQGMTIGLPRCLNMYQDYPFWSALLRSLGFKVKLSPMSSKRLTVLGRETIPSDTICYPAKVLHSHVLWLESRCDAIFLPCLPYNPRITSQDHYNCPIVGSYPEAATKCLEDFMEPGTVVHNPYLPLHDRKRLLVRLRDSMPDIFERFSRSVLKNAINLAFEHQDQFELECRHQNEAIVEYAADNGLTCIALVGRPYHLDAGINHGIPNILNELDCCVVDHDWADDREIKTDVLSQWTYHHKLYVTAHRTLETPHVQYVQLVSFGCGLDAVTSDQIKVILEPHKIYTQLKIDEVENHGAVKIRLRSLMAALENEKANNGETFKSEFKMPLLYTKEMYDEGWSILLPDLSPQHNTLLCAMFRGQGYPVFVARSPPEWRDEILDIALRHVHNDCCYPTLIVVGSLIKNYYHLVAEGKIDPKKVVFLTTQTGGPCRASNYPFFIRKALAALGLSHIPVGTMSMQGIEKHTGFSPGLSMAKKALESLVLGDIIMFYEQYMRPVELEPGTADHVSQKALDKGCQYFLSGGSFREVVQSIEHSFESIKIDKNKKPVEVGLLGEILVKYHPMSNMYVVRELEAQGARVFTPGIMDFILYCMYDSVGKREYLSNGWGNSIIYKTVIGYVQRLRSKYMPARFRHTIHSISDKAQALADRDLISVAFQAGEGWLLVSEAIEMMSSGCDNILCIQPAFCLPQHMLRCALFALRKEGANVSALDLDPGASSVNFKSRVTLFMAVAKRKAMQREMEQEAVAL